MATTRIKIAEQLQNNEAFITLVKGMDEYFVHHGTTIFSGRNTIKTMDVDVLGGEPLRIVVKHFRKPDILKKVSYGYFGSTKAERAFDNGVELLKRGISTPQPYAIVEYSRCGLPQDYYLITSEMVLPPIEDGMPYHENTGPYDKEMAAAFGRFIAELHGKGILHHDLNRTNVLYEKDADGKFHFSLIDINRMKFYDAGTMIPLEECMENMTRYTVRYDIFEFVARAYARERGIDEDMFATKSLALKKAGDIARWRRKAILHPFRKD